MALEMNDLMMLKSLSGNEMTPYEQFKTQHMQSKSQTSGLGIAGLTVGVGAAVASPTNVQPCCSVTNCIAIACTLNVTTV